MIREWFLRAVAAGTLGLISIKKICSEHDLHQNHTGYFIFATAWPLSMRKPVSWFTKNPLAWGERIITKQIQNYEHIEIRLQEPENDGAPNCRQTGEIRPRGIYLLGREHVDACLYPVSGAAKSEGRFSRLPSSILSPLNFRIMKQRRMIYDSTIIVLGAVMFAPCLMLFSSTIIAMVLGFFYSLCLAIFWSSTIIGRWFFRELWRATLRLENCLLPPLGERWIVR